MHIFQVESEVAEVIVLLDDRVETVTPRTMAIMAARPLVALASAVLVALSLSPLAATVWALCVAISESWTWIATSPQRQRRPASVPERQLYFASIIFMNFVWCGLGVLLWLQPGVAFQVAATCLLATQIFHAQTFTAQSPAMLAIVGGFPALTLLTLATIAGDMRGFDRLLVVGAVVILICYAASAAAANARRDRQLQAARNDAIAARDAQARFLSVVGHEVRTPMVGVLGLAGSLKVGALEAVQSQKIDIMIDSGQTLMALIDDLLDFSRLEAGAFSVTRTPFESRKLWAAADILWRPLAHKNELEFHVSADPRVPAWIEGDLRRIGQIINNIIGNALKFTKTGSVSACYCWDEGKLKVSVADTGPGLTEEEVGRLFRPFVQIEQAQPAAKRGGSGLGLHISRQIAHLMGGDLTVTSRPGVGSVFTLSLPAPAVVPVQQEIIDPVLQRTPRILVVDDHEVHRMIIQTILEALECEAVLVADGDAALQAAATGAFDAILMDLNLPRMNGAEIAEQMRSRQLIPDGVPIILMTADPHHRHATSGFAAVLVKPLSAETIAAALRSALARLVQPVASAH